jgi:hypothetical protein
MSKAYPAKLQENSTLTVEEKGQKKKKKARD